MIKLKRFTIPILLLTVLAACNHETFVDRMVIDKTTATLPWTGGNTAFKSNKEIKGVRMFVMRSVNGKPQPVSDIEGMAFQVWPDYDFHLRNDLCDLSVSISGSTLTITSGYNLFADTLYMDCLIEANADRVVYASQSSRSAEETFRTAVRILPSPGYRHEPINYQLSSWMWNETCDTIDLGGLVNKSKIPATMILREKGDFIASTTGRFEPWDTLLSDNIFGRTEIKVEGIRCLPPYYFPELSGDSVIYNRTIHTLPGKDLTADSTMTMVIPPYHSGSAMLLVHREENGIQYTLPAVGPMHDAPRFSIKGVYYISTPVTYEVITTIESAKL